MAVIDGRIWLEQPFPDGVLADAPPQWWYAEAGRVVGFEGVLRKDRCRSVMFNPAYTLLPPHTDQVTAPRARRKES